MPARLSPSRHLRVGRAKSGLGLFARTPIKKGQFIIRYRGKKIRTEDTEELDTRYLFEINNRWTIDGSSRSNRARYINHACRPNAEVFFVKHVIKIWAIKNIKPGDEITYHYGRNIRRFHQGRGLQVQGLRQEEGQVARAQAQTQASDTACRVSAGAKREPAGVMP